MLDVAALSMRLCRKQLTVRLMPVPGKAAGELSSFDSPYMCNARIYGVAEKNNILPKENSEPINITGLNLNLI